MVRLVAVTVLLGVGGLSVLGQQPDRPVLSVGTDLVTLSVSVLDPHGTVVTGLRREHFTVYDEGERRPVEFFSSEDRSMTAGLIVDSSGSMRGRRDDVATAAAAFADLHRAGDQFFALGFNETVWSALPPSLAFTEDAHRLRAALAAAPAQGMTAVYDAVNRGLGQLQQGPARRKVLILISDGGDNASVSSFELVVERARQMNAVIYSVTFFDPDNRDAKPAVLHKLTRETGGRTFTSDRTENTTRAFDQIGCEIRASYTIGFTGGESAVDRFRSIRVIVDAGRSRRLTARTRAGYYAGPSRKTVR